MLTATVEALPPSPATEHLSTFTTWFTGQEPDALEQHYVETFDLRRRSGLYLTYYLHGDTRRRGMALLTLAQRYRATGWDTDGGELPDHLPVVLEYAALAGPRAGEAPLRLHRRGLELIHHALSDGGSPTGTSSPRCSPCCRPPPRPTARPSPNSPPRARPPRTSGSTRTAPAGSHRRAPSSRPSRPTPPSCRP